jgi:hypothetical protein
MFAALTIFLLLTVQSGAEQALKDVQLSHIEANVPAPGDFNRFLLRDLGAYFVRTRKQKSVSVDFELLRDGPTQSGISYPKFYVWVRLDGGKSSDDRGAARIAAVERKQFEITDFVSEQEIRSDKDAIYSAFPGPVCEKIKARLGIVP